MANILRRAAEDLFSDLVGVAPELRHRQLVLDAPWLGRAVRIVEVDPALSGQRTPVLDHVGQRRVHTGCGDEARVEDDGHPASVTGPGGLVQRRQRQSSGIAADPAHRSVAAKIEQVELDAPDPYEGPGFVRPLALASSKTFRTSLSKRIPVSSPSARASLTAYSSR